MFCTMPKYVINPQLTPTYARDGESRCLDWLLHYSTLGAVAILLWPNIVKRQENDRRYIQDSIEKLITRPLGQRMPRVLVYMYLLRIQYCPFCEIINYQ